MGAGAMYGAAAGGGAGRAGTTGSGGGITPANGEVGGSGDGCVPPDRGSVRVGDVAGKVLSKLEGEPRSMRNVPPGATGL
jgi:hypothetical protein